MQKRGGPKIVKSLTLAGGILILLSGSIAVLGFPIGFTFNDGHLMVLVLSGISIYHGIVEMASGAMILLISLFMGKKLMGSVQNLSIIALILSVASLIGGGGFLAGFVLAFIGSILGIGYGYIYSSRPLYQAKRAAGKVEPPLKHYNSNTMFAKEKMLLKPEERRLCDLIQESDGAIFQAELVEKSGFTKVKVTRILDKLEGRGIIERRRRGMTNVVLLKIKAEPAQQAF